MKNIKTRVVNFDRALLKLTGKQLLQFYKDQHNRIYKVNTNEIG